MFKNVILRPPPSVSQQTGANGVAGNASLEHIDDDFRVQDACRDLDFAFSQFHGLGDQPSYQALRVLYGAALELRDALMAAEAFSSRAGRVTRTALTEARDQLKVAMRLEPDSALTKLRHLDLACARYAAHPPGLNRFPPLFAALEAYVFALREQPQLSNAAQRGSEKQAHLDARAQLDAPSRTARLNKFRSSENSYWNKSTTPVKLLKIGTDYRSTPEDHAAFRQLFESGTLLRGQAACKPPQECQALWAHYSKSLASLQQEQRLQPTMPLTDLIALQAYDSSFAELNQALRDNERAGILRLAPYIKSLISALNHLPQCPETADLRRGMRLDAPAIIAAGLFAGNRWSTRSFMSCSVGGNSSYNNTPEKYNVQLRILGGHARLTGAAATAATTATVGVEESQAMYKPGSAFDVVAVDYLEGQGSKEYPRLDVTMQWVDMSRVRVDGRFRNGNAEELDMQGGVMPDAFNIDDEILGMDLPAHQDMNLAD